MLVFPQYSVGRDWKSLCVPCSCCEQIYAFVHMTRSTQALYKRMRSKFPLPNNEMNASYMEAMYYQCVKEQWHCKACGVERVKRVEVEKRTVMLSRPCRDCAYPLYDNPPSYRYLRNHTGGHNRFGHNRRAVTNRQCSRCSLKRAPAWYRALECVARDHYQSHLVLTLIVLRLALDSVYKIPWQLTKNRESRMGRITLFIGEFHCRKFIFARSTCTETEIWIHDRSE